MAYMSETKRKNVMSKRIIAAALAVVVAVAAILLYRNFSSGKISVASGEVVATVNGTEIKSGLVSGMSKLIQYYQFGAFFSDYVGTEGGFTEEEYETQTTLFENYILVDLCVPVEVLKQHFADEGKTVLTAEIQEQIDQSVDSAFDSEEVAAIFKENGIKEEHVRYFSEYSAYMEEYVSEVEAETPTTTDDINEYYETYKTEYFTTPLSMTLSQIAILDEEHTAENLALVNDILAKIEAGEDFAELATEYGQDDSAQYGGDIGVIEEGLVADEIYAAALELASGEASGVIETDDGFYIIKMTAKAEETVTSLEDATADIESALEQEKTLAALDKLVEVSNVVYFVPVNPETGKPPVTEEELAAVNGTDTTDESAAAEEPAVEEEPAVIEESETEESATGTE